MGDSCARSRHAERSRVDGRIRSRHYSLSPACRFSRPIEPSRPSPLRHSASASVALNVDAGAPIVLGAVVCTAGSRSQQARKISIPASMPARLTLRRSWAARSFVADEKPLSAVARSNVAAIAARAPRPPSQSRPRPPATCRSVSTNRARACRCRAAKDSNRLRSCWLRRTMRAPFVSDHGRAE
jgi:hypothetical protein